MGKIWTKKEDAYLFNYYGIKKSAEIAKSLGRTQKSVENRIHKQQLKNKKIMRGEKAPVDREELIRRQLNMVNRSKQIQEEARKMVKTGLRFEVETRDDLDGRRRKKDKFEVVKQYPNFVQCVKIGTCVKRCFKYLDVYKLAKGA